MNAPAPTTEQTSIGSAVARRYAEAKHVLETPAARPFHLLRYFMLASLAVLLPVAAILAYFEIWQSGLFARMDQEHHSFFAKAQEDLNQQHEAIASNDLMRMEEAASVNMARLFANALWREAFAPLIGKAQSLPIERCRAIGDVAGVDGKPGPSAEKQACYADLGRAIRALPEFRGIDGKVAALMRKSSVFKIKVYDLRGVLVYSSEHGEIGEDKADNPGWKRARAGDPASKISHRDSFNAFEGAVANRDLIETYVPITVAAGNEVAAVLEVYADVTEFLEQVRSATRQMRKLSAENQVSLETVAKATETRLEQATRLAIVVILALITALYAALYLIVRHGQRTIDAERMRSDRAEFGLRQTAMELREFADNVPAMTVFLDQELRYVFANKRYTDFFGVDQDTLAGRHLREVVGEAAYAEIEGHYRRALQAHAVTYQRTRTMPDGEKRHLEVKILPRYDEHQRVEGCFVLTSDITEHILAEERIQRMAHHDALTGLPNRLLFNDRLSQTISYARREQHRFALLFLDLDRFKEVNDTLGHAAGDQLLKEAAARMRNQVRESDTVARIGGDEFTVILADIIKRDDVMAVARKIAGAIAQPYPIPGAAPRTDIGTSIGIAIYPDDGADADALVSAADTAMYCAKQTGVGIQFFDARTRATALAPRSAA